MKSLSTTARIAGSILLTLAISQLPSLAQTPGGDEGQRPAFAMGGRMVNGTVTAVAPDKITVKTEAGDTYQVTLTPNTRLMKGREPIKQADIHVGDGIGTMGEIDQPTKTVHALFVSLVDAEQIKKMKESLGKTWIAGKVTAIDDVKITVLRADKVSQTITVDEDTSFRRGGRNMQIMMTGQMGVGYGGRGGEGRTNGETRPGGPPPGEAITLADIKIGDTVAGEGSLKAGVFVPKTLQVADPNQQRRRRPDAEGTTPAAPPATPAATTPATPPTRP